MPLAIQLINDSSSDCKKKVGLVLRNLLGRAGKVKLGEVYKTICVWIGAEETRSLGLQLLGIFAEVGSGGRESDIRSVFLDHLHSEMETNEEGKIRWGEDWQRAYFCVEGLGKVQGGEVGKGKQAGKGKVGKGVADEVVSALAHYHPWVKQAAGSFILASEIKPALRYDVVKGFCAALDSDVKFVNETIILNAIKGLARLAPTLEDDAIKWMFARLGGAAKKSSGGNRMNIFKSFAALIGVVDRVTVESFAALILTAVHRAISEAEAVGNASDEDVEFMRELLVLVEDKLVRRSEDRRKARRRTGAKRWQT